MWYVDYGSAYGLIVTRYCRLWVGILGLIDEAYGWLAGFWYGDLDTGVGYGYGLAVRMGAMGRCLGLSGCWILELCGGVSGCGEDWLLVDGEILGLIYCCSADSLRQS